MTRCHPRHVAFLAAAIIPLFIGCAKQTDTTLKINADGSSTATIVMTLDRRQIESQLQWRRQADSHFDEDIQWDEGSLPVPSGSDADFETEADSGSTPANDSEQGAPESSENDQAERKLAEDIKAMFQEESSSERFDQMHTEVKQVQVKDDEVEIVTEVRFDTLEALVKYLPFSNAGGPVERVQIAQTDQGNVKLTITAEGPGEMDARTRKQYVQMIKAQKLGGSITIVLPGEIVSSTLPVTKASSTSLSLDPQDDDSIDTFFDTLSKPVVIEAKPGALVMDALPLDSDEMEVDWDMHGRTSEDELGADLPITEPAEPYLAEATSVRKVVVRTYPAAKKFEEQLEYGFGMEHESGCTVKARLFPPRTRYIANVASVKMRKAVDDQGRSIESRPESDARFTRYFGMDEQEPGQPTDISVELALPAPDAEAIELIEGEVMLTSFGRWLAHSIDPVKPMPDKPIDLSEILDGATVTILRTATPRPDESDAGELTEGIIQLRLTGPEAIQHLDLGVKIPGFDNIHAYERTSSFERSGEQCIRNVTLEYRPWAFDEMSPARIKPRLVIRFPDDLQRHRVKFKLEAMDLF